MEIEFAIYETVTGCQIAVYAFLLKLSAVIVRLEKYFNSAWVVLLQLNQSHTSNHGGLLLPYQYRPYITQFDFVRLHRYFDNELHVLVLDSFLF